MVEEVRSCEGNFEMQRRENEKSEKGKKIAALGERKN